MLKGDDLFTSTLGKRKVIHKTRQGTLATIEISLSQLTALSGDTSAVGK
jgi:hypothetical protein